MHDLEETGHPYDDVMRKVTFLDNIEHPGYKENKTVLALDDKKTYEECVMEIRRAAVDVESTRERRHVNFQGPGKGRGQRSKQNQNKLHG